MSGTPEQFEFEFDRKKKIAPSEGRHYESPTDCPLCGNEYASHGKCQACQNDPRKEEFLRESHL